MWIVDKLVNNPHEIVPLHSYMLTANSSLDPRAAGQSDWSGNYSQLGAVPKTFMMRYLLKRGQDLGLQTMTQDLLTKLEKSDASNVPALFGFDL